MAKLPQNTSAFGRDPDVAPKDDATGGERPPIRHRVRRAPAAPPDPQAPSEKPADYVVGYCRPPAHSRFKPGSSGNPKGRPKGATGLKTLVREMMTAKVPVRTADGETKMRRIEAVLHKTFEAALKGNPRAQSQMLSLYAAAVPELAVAGAEVSADEFTATDVAMLEELKAIMMREDSDQ